MKWITNIFKKRPRHFIVTVQVSWILGERHLKTQQVEVTVPNGKHYDLETLRNHCRNVFQIDPVLQFNVVILWDKELSEQDFINFKANRDENS